MTSPPRLVLVAHGTRSVAGRRELCRLLLRTRRRLPGVVVRLAWVDVQKPGPGRVLADGVPSVLVPAFLSRGHHVTHDVVEAAGRAPGPVVVTGHLGDEPEMHRALLLRLAEAGGTRCDAVVLAAAGSRDPGARAEIDVLSRKLGALLGVPSSPAFASAAQPRVPAAVRRLRAEGMTRVAVATHLLAPGHFADTIAREGSDSGAHVVSPPLGACDDVVQLVARRYTEAAENVR